MGSPAAAAGPGLELPRIPPREISGADKRSAGYAWRVGIGKLGGIAAFVGEVCEAVRFGVQLGLSCRSVRMQFFELLRRDAPRPAARIGVAANILDGASGRQAVYVTMEPAPRPNPGLWMRIDIFGREGYRQTFYPFWRNAEVFHDFLASCAEIAEATRKPRSADADDEGEEPGAPPAVVVDADPLSDAPIEPASPGDRLPAWPETRRVIGRAERKGGRRGRRTWHRARPARPRRHQAGQQSLESLRWLDWLQRLPWRHLVTAWVARRLRSARREAGTGYLARQQGSVGDPWRTSQARGEQPHGHGPREEQVEPDSLALQTTDRRAEATGGSCSLMSFTDLSAALDHVLLSGNRIAIKVIGEGPDLWAVVWRRADGGLFLRWGGLEHPAGPVYRESPRTLYQKLSAYELDLDRVWSQHRPVGGI